MDRTAIRPPRMRSKGPSLLPRKPSPEHVGVMAHLPDELLAQPIALNACPGATIVEWRQTPGDPLTAPSKRGTKVIAAVCANVAKRVGEFLKRRRVAPPHPHVELSVTISLLPTIGPHGRAPRNMNDIAWRFRYRSKTYLPNGDVAPIWGYYQRNAKHIYMRNDPLSRSGRVNRKFIVVLAHELFQN